MYDPFTAGSLFEEKQGMPRKVARVASTNFDEFWPRYRAHSDPRTRLAPAGLASWHVLCGTIDMQFAEDVTE